MTSVNLHYLPKAFSKYNHIGIRTSSYKFWGDRVRSTAICLWSPKIYVLDTCQIQSLSSPKNLNSFQHQFYKVKDLLNIINQSDLDLIPTDHLQGHFSFLKSKAAGSLPSFSLVSILFSSNYPCLGWYNSINSLLSDSPATTVVFSSEHAFSCHLFLS